MTTVNTSHPRYHALDTNNASSDDAADQPRFGILLQYVKDVSFENFDPSGVFLQDKEKIQPQINVQFDVRQRQIDATRYEVTLTVRATAEINTKTAYIAEVTHAAVVGMQNIPSEHQGPLLNIEVPRQLFPFTRALIADLTREGNYSALMINSIDLLQLYQRKLADQQQKTASTDTSSNPA